MKRNSVLFGLRILAVLGAVLATVTQIYPRNGGFHILLWGPKLWGAALSPVLAVLGAASTGLGFWHKDKLLFWAGIVGAVASVKHAVQVTASQDERFVEIFGPDWESALEPDSCLGKQRWQPVARTCITGPMVKNVVYATNPETGQPLLADIMQPPAHIAPTGLAFMYMHGGAWFFGRKNIDKLPCFRHLAAQGHLVMDIDYSLAPHVSVQEMVVDVKRAVLWLKQHAAGYHINPDRIVLSGQSAGAQLALLTAYTPNHVAFQPPEVHGDTSVRAVVSYYGPPDLETLHHTTEARFGHLSKHHLAERLAALLEITGNPGNTLLKGIVSGVMGGTPEEIPEMYDLLSPVRYAHAGCPPTLIMHGTHDVLVSTRESEALYAALRRAGTPVVYLTFPGCDHAFDVILPRISPSAQTAGYYLERFLALMV